MRRLIVAAALMASILPATAQNAAPTVTTGNAGTDSMKGSAVQRLLVEGYEIKTGFIDPSGGAYLVLQKAASAYMCHSNPTATCEKLN